MILLTFLVSGYKKEELKKNTHIENPDVFTIYSSQWYQYNGIYYFDKDIKETTQRVFDEGGIMVFAKVPWEDSYYALPLNEIGYYFKPGKLSLFFNSSNKPDFNSNIKVVIINSTDIKNNLISKPVLND